MIGHGAVNIVFGMGTLAVTTGASDLNKDDGLGTVRVASLRIAQIADGRTFESGASLEGKVFDEEDGAVTIVFATRETLADFGNHLAKLLESYDKPIKEVAK